MAAHAEAPPRAGAPGSGGQRGCWQRAGEGTGDPQRLIGLALISLYDVDEAVKELRRWAKLGLRGALIWCSPPEDQPYCSPVYDPFWATAQELDMPLSLHAITGMGPESQGHHKDRYIRFVASPMEVQRSLTTLIFSGVLERYPGLKIVSAENDIGWLSFFLQRVDGLREEFRSLEPRALQMKPSEYFQRQIWACFITNPIGVANRRSIGVDNLMWSSDYPHVACTWPHSHEIIERDFHRGCPRRKSGRSSGKTWPNSTALICSSALKARKEVDDDSGEPWAGLSFILIKEPQPPCLRRFRCVPC